MKKAAKNALNKLPKEYLTALSLLLPEMPFGDITVFISNKLQGWDEINRRLKIYNGNTAQDAGVIYRPVADGALLTMNYAMIVERIPLIEDALDTSGVAEELRVFPELHKSVHNAENARLAQYLSEVVRPGVRNSRVIFGAYARGGTGQYADIGGEHYPIFKVDVDSLIRVLMDLYAKQHCPIAICSLTGVTDITPLFQQYAKGTPQARKKVLDALKARLYGDCVQSFEGNALMYTFIFN